MRSCRRCCYNGVAGRQQETYTIRLILSGQRQVVLVRPTGTVLVLHVLHYPELVRACPLPLQPSNNHPGTPEETHLAGLLVDAVSGAVVWADYRDESAAELRALVEAKLQGQTPTAEAAPVILPLLAALQQSVAATQPVAAAAPAGAEPAPRKRGRRRA
jgi:non-homologous end joining protein Ku